jgi:hypothetical protein
MAMGGGEDRTPVAPVFWIAVGLAAVAAAAAILVARGLVYDGAFYLLGIAARGDRSWIAGPLLNLVFAIPATSFIGIGEGIIASCLLWLAFLLIEFRSRSTTGALASVVAVAACAFSHEAAILCLLVIALTAALQIRDARGFCRAALFLAAAIALAGAANMARWILFPRSVVERGDFLASMGGFLGWPSDPNIPAVASVIAAVALLVALAAKRKRVSAAAVAAAALIAILLVVIIAGGDWLIAPSRFFAARGLPVALTTLLAGFFLMLRRRDETPDRFVTRPVAAIVLCLAIFQPAAQAFITERWALYVHALQELVSAQSGVVPHALAMRRLDPQGNRFRHELLESWSVEPLAILLAPGGHVRAFVEAAPNERWVPYNPRNPAKLPHAPGLDWGSFVPRPVP